MFGAWKSLYGYWRRENIAAMTARLRVIVYFAIAGASVPILLLLAGVEAFDFRLAVCPSSIFFLALDGPTSLGYTVYVWSAVCIANALLYGFVGVLVAVAMALCERISRNRSQQT
jgi:hypothetical protein